jgi:hypothetical protein
MARGEKILHLNLDTSHKIKLHTEKYVGNIQNINLI